MNKFRKILIGMLVAAGAACLGGAVACGDAGSTDSNGGGSAPAYYQLDVNGGGFDIAFEGDLAELDEKGEGFKFGGAVKEGLEVRFKVIKGANTEGTPVIKVNDTTLTADSNGVYSFVMRKDSTISVTGLNSLHTVKLVTVKESVDEDGNKTVEERRIKFYDETGSTLLGDEVRIPHGEDFTFSLWTSPYYEEDFTVSNGFEELVSESSVAGKNLKLYTVHNVSEDGEINVTDLKQQLSFANYDDPATYGDGTEANPYKISKPVDLFYLAVLVNSEFDSSTFSPLYYEMTADIDLDGEQLYVIGNGENDTASFSGHFNGNGHTIKNFFITDEAVNQETFDKKYLPNVGLFGNVSAYIDNDYVLHTASIENVNLENYKINTNPGLAGESACVGSLVGYGVGVEISGCNAVGGNIRVDNDNQVVLMGGLVGRLQGAYGSSLNGKVAADSFVRYSSADVTMYGLGSPRSAGGIAGYLISAEENAIAYIVNCYSKGSINGAMHTGGIAGTLGRFSSVSNCYSTAQISASNTFGGMNVSEDFKGAYAGGIVGYAEESTVIYGCYSANDSISAFSADGPTGKGPFAGGYISANAKAAHLSDLVLFNNSEAVANHPADTFKTTLGWLDSEWNFSGRLPAIKIPATQRTLKITAVQASNPVSRPETSLAAIGTMSYWYRNGLAEYRTNPIGRSWGYYFDKELTLKVPFGFVPVKAETVLYVDYANYNNVAGTYYVAPTAYSNGAYITLTKDGAALIRNGGMSYEGRYSYDGKNNKLTFYNSALAALSYSEAQINGEHHGYGGSIDENGVLTLEAYLELFNPSGSAEQGNLYVTVEDTLRAVKETALVCGEYQDENGVTYLFNKNGTGVMTDRGAKSAFTYLPKSNSFKITFAGAGGRQMDVTVANDRVATVNSVDVQLKDGFKGSWQKNANAFTVFTFDGIDTVTMSVAGQSAKQAQYTVDGSGAAGFEIDDKEYKATISDGRLVINGEAYFVSDGFTGKWFMIDGDVWIELELGGIGTEGYGEAVVTYSGQSTQVIDAQYDVLSAAEGNYLRIYVDDTQYGELLFNAGGRSATGTFYSLIFNRYDSLTFSLYDSIGGTWTGVSDDFDTVTFNGRSASSKDAKVTVTSAGNAVTRGTYTLVGASGTMTVNDVTYTLSYSENDNRVTVTRGDSSEQLAQRDEWYKVKLYEGETEYEFDGKSKVGGSVKVREDGAVIQTLVYTVESGAVTLDGKPLTPNASGYAWDGKTLTVKSGFAGEWMISGSDEVLTITEVNGFNQASVTCTGVSGTYSFEYSFSAQTLTLTEGEVVTVLKTSGENEMNITRTGGADGYKKYNCAKSSIADGYKGEYTAEDGSKWKFDGLGACRYGSGTAVFTPESGEAVKYRYDINEVGYACIRAEETLLFVPADGEEDGVFVKDGAAYKTVAVDEYYGVTVFGSTDRKSYYFDGVNGVWKETDGAYEKAYTYEAVKNMQFEIIDGDGVRFNGKIEESGLAFKLTVSEQIKAEADGVTYAIGIAVLWKVNDDGSYEKAYDLAATKTAKQYELTDEEGNKYTATLVTGEEGNTLEIVAKEEN